MAAKASIRDVGRALGYDYPYCDRIAKMIPLGFTLNETLEKVQEFSDLYESDKKAERLIDLALKIEGCARHASTHACGVVISRNPLTIYTHSTSDSGSQNGIVTQYEVARLRIHGTVEDGFLGIEKLNHHRGSFEKNICRER